ncbi:MAG: hypothetical protein AAFV01_04775, partial [Bacteroidota bacterium]
MTRALSHWTPLLIATLLVVSGFGVGSTEARAQRIPQVTQGAKDRLDDLLADWQVYKDERDAIVNTEM